MTFRLKHWSQDVASRSGYLVTNSAFYTHRTGPHMMSRISYSSRSDTTDISSIRFSCDNGATWSEPITEPGPTHTNAGVLRRVFLPGFVDPIEDRLMFVLLQGTLPTDNPLEGSMRWGIRYAVSVDGGKTLAWEAPVIQSGNGYCEEHPFKPVWVGKNSLAIGDKTCVPMWLRNGTLLVPVQITPLDENGHLFNPGGGYTYHHAAVLMGTRSNGYEFTWDISDQVALDPALSTRGCIEPTLAELPDGRVLMIIRGSNDVKPEIPGHKWYSVSNDGGRTWTPPQPWCYDDGKPFFSPSSCSQLLTHSSGRLFWIGNISPTNPRGNLPRYPLVIGEVDLSSLRLQRKSICIVADRQDHESEGMTLSNFYAHEDRVTQEIVVYCSRFLTQKSWDGDAFIYRVGYYGIA